MTQRRHLATPQPNLFTVRVKRIAANIKRWLARHGVTAPVTTAITLGSGLGGYGSDHPSAITIPYAKVGLPKCGMVGHAGVLRFMQVGKHGILIFDGRAHGYEGYPIESVVMAVRAAAFAGATTQVITCASGGINPNYVAGQLVVIKDHLNLMGRNPLTGRNDQKHGPRFPDMTQAYDPELRTLAGNAGKAIGLTLAEGVYAALSGPNYETPAEVRMLSILGADMVGMSTVPEVLALRHLSVRVLGISCIANKAASTNQEPLSHDEVVAAGRNAAPRFKMLLDGIVESLPLPETTA